VLWSWPDDGWQSLLDETDTLEGTPWDTWCDGGAARRFAGIIERTVDHFADRRAAG
jgi:hypothetical protein